MNTSPFVLVALLAALFQLAWSAGLNKPEIRKEAQTYIVGKGEAVDLNRSDLGVFFGIIFKTPRDKSMLDRTFKDLKVNNIVSEERIMYHCEALGHLLNDQYFQPFNLTLDEDEISNRIQKHSKGGKWSYDNFKESVPKVYSSGLDPLGDQVLTWYKALNMDDKVELQEIIDLCKNTAHLLRKDLIK